MRAGLLILAATFVGVSLILVAQQLSVLVGPLPRLHYLLALGDVPATVGAWIAAVAAFGRRTEAIGRASRRLLVIAALALSGVALVVYADLVVARVAPASSLARALSSNTLWAVVGGASAVALAALWTAAERAVSAAGGALNRELHHVVIALLVARVGALAISLSVPIPIPLRFAEVALYAAVAATLIEAARHCRPSAAVST